MNISFVRNGSEVQVKLTVSVPGIGDSVYTASMSVGSEYYAAFVREAIASQSLGATAACVEDEMSMIRCDRCVRQIDTDEHPETYDEESDMWVCHPCRDETMEAHRREWLAASPEERNPDQHRRDMISAGRGHLLRD